MRYGREVRKSQAESFGVGVGQHPRQKEILLAAWGCHIADNGRMLGDGECWKWKSLAEDGPTIIADRAARGWRGYG